MKKSDAKKILESVTAQQEADGFTGGLNRARSVTVGTAFGGTTELMMRKNDGTVVWALLQPVETVELIHQLAANIGCHIHVQPRDDFASWRDWRHTDFALNCYRGEQHLPGVGHAPHNKVLPHNPVSKAKKEAKLQPALMARSNENEQTLATQKTVGRKRTKRAAATA
jgi:hypothetical protein